MALALILNYEEILSWVCFMGLPQREKEEEEIVVVLLKDLMNVCPIVTNTSAMKYKYSL